MDKAIAIELKGISKQFGEVVANKNVSLDVRKGEILSLLGENGSGKTTLMNMLAGIYFPDDGKILINGEEVVIRSPKDAFRLRIGMIHQHFKLVDVYSAIDNIILGETLDFDNPAKEKDVPADTQAATQADTKAGIQADAKVCQKAYSKIYARLAPLAKALSLIHI